jgi:hypothetical protein
MFLKCQMKTLSFLTHAANALAVVLQSHKGYFCPTPLLSPIDAAIR